MKKEIDYEGLKEWLKEQIEERKMDNDIILGCKFMDDQDITKLIRNNVEIDVFEALHHGLEDPEDVGFPWIK